MNRRSTCRACRIGLFIFDVINLSAQQGMRHNKKKLFKASSFASLSHDESVEAINNEFNITHNVIHAPGWMVLTFTINIR